MLDLRLVDEPVIGPVLALPVLSRIDGSDQDPDRQTADSDRQTTDPDRQTTDSDRVAVLAADDGLDEDTRAEVVAFLGEVEHSGSAGSVHTLPRPTRTPRKVLLLGVGDGDEGGWRAAGAALARTARTESSLTVVLPVDAPPPALRGLAEGMWLAGYRYRFAAGDGDDADPALAEVTVVGPGGPEHIEALRTARVVAEFTRFARDLTNTPSNVKTPAWFADQIVTAAAGITGVDVEVWDPQRLAAERFGGVLAVGRGSQHEPRLVRVSWDPPGATRHVVLVGKGITFDTGGIGIKPKEAMRLMRKDMGGAAAVTAAALAAAALESPVRVTALAPLAENAVGADALRPGDVVRHQSGVTSLILNTDAEGRLVLADALGYAAETLDPDVLVDLATLTGAQNIALGKRTAALFTEDPDLAGEIGTAADAAGEAVWRLPLVEEYVERLDGDIADLANSVETGGGGCITAALYLREFTGSARGRWVHLDMSAPAWSDSASGELAKGATGWGVRTLLRWLGSAAGR